EGAGGGVAGRRLERAVSLSQQHKYAPTPGGDDIHSAIAVHVRNRQVLASRGKRRGHAYGSAQVPRKAPIAFSLEDVKEFLLRSRPDEVPIAIAIHVSRANTTAYAAHANREAKIVIKGSERTVAIAEEDGYLGDFRIEVTIRVASAADRHVQIPIVIEVARD